MPMCPLLLPADVPTPELLARLRAEGYRPPPRLAPNLGYACLNMELRELKPPVFTSRWGRGAGGWMVVVVV